MKTLDKLPSVNRPGRKPKHPYNDWFEAATKAPIQLTQGDDFDCAVKTMQHNIYRHAKNENLDVDTVILGDQNALAIKVVGKRTAKRASTKKSKS